MNFLSAMMFGRSTGEQESIAIIERALDDGINVICQVYSATPELDIFEVAGHVVNN